jgi:hypothetical protein
MRNGSDDHTGRRERRRYKRTHVLFSGSLVSGKRAIEGLVLDLSLNGARIQFSEPIVTNSAATLRLAGSVDIDVEVAWREDNRLGLRFREMPARISSIFAGLLPEECLATA